MGLDARVRLGRGSLAIDAEISANAGEPVALLGPNGAGKSTVVAALAGLLPLEEGAVTLDGEALDDVASGLHVAARDRDVGVVFQGLLLFPHLSAIDNVAFPLRARGVRRADAAARAGGMLARLGVGHVAAARPQRLSGGEAQRVALARALVGEPRLLLLDEPLSTLDVRARGRVRSLLRETLASFGGAAIVVSHDPVDAMTLAGRLILMEGGRVTQAGSPAEIRAAPRSPYAADLVGVNFFAGRLEAGGDGAALLRTGAGDVVVSPPPEVTLPLDDVVGLLRPADVSLFPKRPEGSARNTLPGMIEWMSFDAERARVGLGTAPPLVAELTAGSARRLGLREGMQVWASFKALEVRLVLP